MSEQISRIQYNGDGYTTNFAYPFTIFAIANLKVYLNAEQITTGWRINKIDDAGSIIFDTAPEINTTITIERQLPIERHSDFQDGGIIKAKTLNDELDYRVGVEAQINDKLNRSLTYAANMPANFNSVLPYPSAKKALIWSDDGLSLKNSNDNLDEVVSNITNQISSVQNLATTISTQAEMVLTNANETATKLEEINTIATNIDTLISAKANDNEVMHLSGDESLTGVKTFAISPIVPPPNK